MTEAQVRKALKRACEAAGSQREFARQAGVSAVYVGDVLAGKRAPGKAILAFLRIAKESRPAIYRPVAAQSPTA